MNKTLQAAFFGGLLLDRYLEVDRFPHRGGDGVITGEYDLVGGCAINMAAAFQNLGGEAHVVASLGDGSVGRRIGDYLDLHGFSRRFIAPAPEDNGYCFVFLEPDGERSFLTRDSLGLFPQALLDGHTADIPWAALTGYYLLEQPEAVSRFLENYVQQGGRLLYDPGPLLSRLDPEAQARCVQAAAVLSLNEAEAAELRPPLDGSKTVIIKKGAAGGSVYGPEGRFNYDAVPAQSIDGTGAGDAFAGALVYGLAAGQSLKAAVDLAARAAAKTVELQGPHGFWEL